MSSLLAEALKPQTAPIEDPTGEVTLPDDLARDYELGLISIAEAVQGSAEAPIPMAQNANTVTPITTPESAHEGVSVSIHDYYTALRGLAKIGHEINKNANFIDQTRDPNSKSYWVIKQRYQLDEKDLAQAIKNAPHKKDRLSDQAQSEFKLDLFPQVDPELMSQEDYDQIATETSAAFGDQFFGRKNKDNLAELQKHTEKQLKRFDKLHKAA